MEDIKEFKENLVSAFQGMCDFVCYILILYAWLFVLYSKIVTNNSTGYEVTIPERHMLLLTEIKVWNSWQVFFIYTCCTNMPFWSVLTEPVMWVVNLVWLLKTIVST